MTRFLSFWEHCWFFHSKVNPRIPREFQFAENLNKNWEFLVKISIFFGCFSTKSLKSQFLIKICFICVRKQTKTPIISVLDLLASSSTYIDNKYTHVWLCLRSWSKSWINNSWATILNYLIGIFFIIFAFILDEEE